MGSGWYEHEHVGNGFPFLDARGRFDLFAEQVEVVVRSWTETVFDHVGPAYRLDGQAALPQPFQSPNPPLVLGGTVRPRFAALAARFATEVNTLGAPNDELRDRRDRLVRACRDAGRDPDTLGYSVMTACFVGSDRGEVLDRLRAFLALGARDDDPEELLESRRDRWLVGTVDEVAERIAQLEEVGVTRVFLQHLNHDDDDMVALVGERLLPEVASLESRG
jgi:alkanesulfonate monooxygenase SsuD/methylene tetrahydromethanopterin reductase-like flavin-dependent oxidoreductase (luciferase family)